MLAGKLAAVLIGIDNAGRRWRNLPRQMVIGNQHLQTQGIGCLYPIDAGNAVVYRNNHIRLSGGCQGNDFRSQSVAVFKTVRHQKIHSGAKSL